MIAYGVHAKIHTKSIIPTVLDSLTSVSNYSKNEYEIFFIVLDTAFYYNLNK